MIQRIYNLSKSRSFFLLGPRGVGKSTLLKQWKQGLSVYFVDLLDPSVESHYSLHPERLIEDWKAQKTEWIVIDEIQKNPELLNVVHLGIAEYKIKFALTGSSARKIRRNAANLLGGRASEFKMHPLTHIELKHQFNLIDVLKYGTLPEIHTLDQTEKIRALYAYVSTYLKEEVLVEQIIRKIEPFRRFLEVAGQMNGKILNYRKISIDSGVEQKSVARYYQILEDTLLGFFLEPYHQSIRKRQSQKAKFYFFDTGVTRALQNTVKLDVTEQTTTYGDLFEQFVFLEFVRLNDIFEKRFKFSYLKTKDNVEVDLIIERPGQPIVLVEIKSSRKVDQNHGDHLIRLQSDFKNAEMYVLNNSNSASVIKNVKHVNWQKGLKEIFEI